LSAWRFLFCFIGPVTDPADAPSQGTIALTAYRSPSSRTAIKNNLKLLLDMGLKT
jgi:hypothetical protein